MNKYINYAIVGNDKVTATFSKQGELLRFFYPTVDFKQFVEWFRVGIKINDSMNILLHDDINNIYMQKYLDKTNILQTEILNTYFHLRILQTDFVPINENVLVRNYILKNESNSTLNINMLFDSNILTNINNDTCGYIKNDCLIQYNHDYTVSLFSNTKLSSYQVNNVQSTIWSGHISGKDYVGLSSNSAISYDLQELKPGEEKEFTLYFMVKDNYREKDEEEIDNTISRIRALDVNKLLNECKEYWINFVQLHDRLNIENSKLDSKIKDIYTRTILLYPLLQNSNTGGISAGVEVDEEKTKCGRYSYCWPRDAVFIAKAQDILGMTDETTKFYNCFCQNTQSQDGKWEQRFYTDGNLAPSWGYQIDETASVVIGLYEHYLKINDIEFLKKNYNMMQKAIEFLKQYTDDILSKTPKMQKSYDLWEEHEGISLYSIAAIYYAFKSAFKMNIILNGNDTGFELDEYALKLQKYTIENFFDEETRTLVRNLDDKKMDSSILGAVIPFQMMEVDSREIINTVQKMEMTLRTYTGGFLRYEGDTYMNGNPWVISTLWMALYYIEAEQIEKALECFDFTVKTSTEHGFLGEQVDNNSMQAIWVIGLAWSHAMFVIVLEKLIEKGII